MVENKADRPTTADEIEITEEMIAAGIEAANFLSYERHSLSEGMLVARVYLAMDAARRANPSGQAQIASKGQRAHLVNDDGTRARLIAAAPLLLSFHDAWVESQVAQATGSREIAKEKREALIAAHKAVNAALREPRPEDQKVEQ